MDWPDHHRRATGPSPFFWWGIWEFSIGFFSGEFG
jgi:hypothetical protein